MISIKKTLEALTTRAGKTLWTGSWNSGTITVPDTDKYTTFIITTTGKDTAILAVKHPNGTIRGMGGYAYSSTTATTYEFTARFSGNTWTFVYCTNMDHTSSAKHKAQVNLVVEGIYGYL